MTNQTSSRSEAANTAPGAPLPDRVAAIELLLQQMLFVMDAQGTLRAEDLNQWIHTAASRMHATGSVSPGPLRALEQLSERVYE